MEAYKNVETTRSLKKLLRSRASFLLLSDRIPPETPIYHLFTTSEQNKPAEGRCGKVIIAEPHSIFFSNEMRRPSDTAYEDVRLVHKSDLAWEFSIGYVEDYVSDYNEENQFSSTGQAIMQPSDETTNAMHSPSITQSRLGTSALMSQANSTSTLTH